VNTERHPGFDTPYVSPNFPDGRAIAFDFMRFQYRVPPMVRDLDILYFVRSARSTAEEQWLIHQGFPTDPQLHELTSLDMATLEKKAKDGNPQAMVALAQRMPKGADWRSETGRTRWYFAAAHRGSLYGYWALFDDQCRKVNCLSSAFKPDRKSPLLNDLVAMRQTLYSLMLRGDDKATVYLDLLPVVEDFSIRGQREALMLAYAGLRDASRANDFPTNGLQIYPRPRNVSGDFY
jgi:hypothetical protein